MKNIPFPVKFLGISVLFVYAGTLAFSSYLNLFILESITNSLSQIIRSKVDINSIGVRFREGLVLTINGIEIRSNYKNQKLFSAKKVSSLITYSSLISGSLKIKKSYIHQPNIYVQNLLIEHEKLFPGFYLRKIVESYIPNDNNLVTSFNKKKLYRKTIPINLFDMPNPNLLLIAANDSSENIVPARIENRIKNIIIRLGKSINSIEVIQARIMFSKAKKPLFLLGDLSGSFRIRILNPKKDNFNLIIDKIDLLTKKYRVIGTILGENVLSEDALIQTDVTFVTSHITDEVKIKFNLPLKKVNNFKSLVMDIDLNGSFFARNLRLPNKIAKSHVPTIQMNFKLKKGIASYDFTAVCPMGYVQKTKFTEGVITSNGTGSLNFKNKDHITIGLNSNFRVKDCESPDYFKWLNELSKLKVFKEQNFISTNAHGTASLIIDYLIPKKDFSVQGSLNIKDLTLLAPRKNMNRKPWEIQILSIIDNQTTLSWKNQELTFNTDNAFPEGEIGSHGTIDFTERGKMKGPWVDSYFKVDGFNLRGIKAFNMPKSGVLSGDIHINGSINDIKSIFIEGSIIGDNLKLNIHGFQQEFSRVEINIKNLSEMEKKITINSIFPDLTGEVRIFPDELRFVPTLKASIGGGKFSLDGNIDLIKKRHEINFIGKRIKFKKVENGYMHGVADFSGRLYGKLVETSSPKDTKEMIKILDSIKFKSLASSLSGNLDLSVRNGSIDHLRSLKGKVPRRRQVMISNLLEYTGPSLIKFNNHGGLSFISLIANSSISNGFLTIKELSLVNPFLSFSSQGQLNIIDKILSAELVFLKTQEKEKSYKFRLEGFFPLFGDKRESLELTPNLN